MTIKLEEKEKAYNNTEGDVGGLARRALLLEEDVERYLFLFLTLLIHSEAVNGQIYG